MSYKHHPTRWWKDEAAERAAYDERTACRDVIHRMLVWQGPLEEVPRCPACGHPITAHTAVAYVNREPVDPLVWRCGEPSCECATEAI